MRKLLILALAFPLFPALHAQPHPSPCAALSPQTLEKLTAIHGMQPRTTATSKPGLQTCTYYWPNAPAAAGRNGVNPGADLVLELFHFPTVAAAQAKLAERGMTVPSQVLTDSPLGTDEIGDLEHLLRIETEEYLVMRGSAARHGTDVAILGMSDGFAYDSSTNAQLQAAALTAAGAHVVPAAREDACANIPANSLQTLVSLHSSSILIADRTFQNATNTCIWRVDAEDANADQPVFLTLAIQPFLTHAEAVLAMGKHADARPIPHTADPTDLAVSHRGEAPGVVAVHGNRLVTFTISSASQQAVQAASYGYRLERTALTAAGASFPPDPSAPMAPLPVPLTLGQKLQRALALAWDDYAWAFFVLPIIAWLVFRWYRRRDLRLHGMPGTAVIHSISDTGVTINNNPRVRLHMTITPQRGDPYQATSSTTVSRLNPSSVVGQTVNVRIDPTKPSRFVIV